MFSTKLIFRIFTVLFIIGLTLATTSLQVAQAAGIRYAKPVASGTGDCLSWDNACPLQTALAGATDGDEIWVAAGTYKPGLDRSATFYLISGVKVYGGFAGTETILTQRDPKVNVTILSGDISGDDIGFTNNSENAYHVVYGASAATLDGFTIRGGNANSSWPDDYGGGLYNGYASTIVTNVTFTGNWGTKGGGIGNYYASPALTDVTFSGNSATSGGGMYTYFGTPTLTNVTFSENSAISGGGMYNEYNTEVVLTNVTFSNNSATNGGGIYTSWSTLTMYNGTLRGNSATGSGGGISNNYSLQYIYNTIFWENTAVTDAQIYHIYYVSSITYSVIQGDCPPGNSCANIITTDPMLGTLGDNGGNTQTIPLLSGSSAIDMGNDSVCPLTDQRGMARPQGTNCDIGAFEAEAEIERFYIYLPIIIR